MNVGVLPQFHVKLDGVSLESTPKAVATEAIDKLRELTPDVNAAFVRFPELASIADITLDREQRLNILQEFKNDLDASTFKLISQFIGSWHPATFLSNDHQTQIMQQIADNTAPEMVRKHQQHVIEQFANHMAGGREHVRDLIGGLDDRHNDAVQRLSNNAHLVSPIIEELADEDHEHHGRHVHSTLHETVPESDRLVDAGATESHAVAAEQSYGDIVADDDSTDSDFDPSAPENQPPAKRAGRRRDRKPDFDLAPIRPPRARTRSPSQKARPGSRRHSPVPDLEAVRDTVSTAPTEEVPLTRPWWEKDGDAGLSHGAESMGDMRLPKINGQTNVSQAARDALSAVIPDDVEPGQTTSGRGTHDANYDAIAAAHPTLVDRGRTVADDYHGVKHPLDEKHEDLIDSLVAMDSKHQFDSIVKDWTGLQVARFLLSSNTMLSDSQRRLASANVKKYGSETFASDLESLEKKHKEGDERRAERGKSRESKTRASIRAAVSETSSETSSPAPQTEDDAAAAIMKLLASRAQEPRGPTESEKRALKAESEKLAKERVFAKSRKKDEDHVSARARQADDVLLKPSPELIKLEAELGRKERASDKKIAKGVTDSKVLAKIVRLRGRVEELRKIEAAKERDDVKAADARAAAVKREADKMERTPRQPVIISK